MNYEEALNMVAEMDKEMLETLKQGLQDIKDCTDEAQANLADYTANLPAATTTVSRARATVDQIYSSVLSLQQQVTYMLTTVDNQLFQHQPPQQLPLPPEMVAPPIP